MEARARNPLAIKEELDDEEGEVYAEAVTRDNNAADFSQDNTSDDEDYSRDSDLAQLVDLKDRDSLWSPDWSSIRQPPPATKKRGGSSRNLSSFTSVTVPSPQASPATVDFCVVLDRDFQSLVMDRLSRQSRTAVADQASIPTLPLSIKKKIQKEVINVILDYLIEVLRATRDIRLRESRHLAATMRKYCGLLFDPASGEDSLAHSLLSGLRYRNSLVWGRRGDPIAESSVSKVAGERRRKVKDAYLVNKHKYHATASSEEMQMDLSSLELLPLEDGHRVLQARIRERNCSLTAFASVLGSYEALKKQFDWLFDGEVTHLVHENLQPELEKIELFLRARAQGESKWEVLAELEVGTRDQDELMHWVRVLRAADIYWNPAHRPVLFLLEGEVAVEEDGEEDEECARGPRVLVRQHKDGRICFDLVVAGGHVLIEGLESLEKAVSSFLHVSFVSLMSFPKGSGILCTVLQRHVAKLDEFGTQAQERRGLVNKDEKMTGRIFRKTLVLYETARDPALQPFRKETPIPPEVLLAENTTFVTLPAPSNVYPAVAIGSAYHTAAAAVRAVATSPAVASSAFPPAAADDTPTTASFLRSASSSSETSRSSAELMRMPPRGQPTAQGAVSDAGQAVGRRRALSNNSQEAGEEAVVVASKATAAKRIKGGSSQKAYLVNEAKFHAVVSEEELQLELRLDGTEVEKEQAHRIIQHKLSNRSTKLKTCLPVLTSYEALKSQFDWLMDNEEDVALRIRENLAEELENLELFLREIGEEDVLEELVGMSGCGDQLKQMSILRAADIYWNPHRRPVLCSLRGDKISGDSPRILAKLSKKQVLFDLAVEGEPFIVGLDSLEKAISSFIHVCFVANMQFPKGSGVLCTLLQRWVAKLDEYGSQTGSGDLACDEDKQDERFHEALGEYSRKLFIIAARGASGRS